MSHITQVKRIPLNQHVNTLDTTITQACQIYQAAGLALSTSYVYGEQLVLIFQTPLPAQHT